MTLPEGWASSPLGGVSSLIMGQSPDSKYYSDEEENGLPFLQGCAEFQAHFPEPKTYCSKGKKVAPAGAILFSVRAPVGRLNLADRDYIVGRGLAAISGTRINQNYLEQYLRLEEPRFAYASQGSTFEAINSAELSGWPINYPEDPEVQSKIAEILLTADRAIEQTSALIAKQTRIGTGLMQALLTNGIDERGDIRSEETHRFKDSKLGRIPEEWNVDLLDTLAIRGSGHTPNKLRPEYWNGGVKWVSLSDSRKLDHILIETTEKEISEAGLRNSSAVLHPRGTVILSRDAGVGKSAILGDQMAVSQHFMAWRCKSKKLDNFYLYYWLQRDKPLFEGIASGSTIVTIGLQFFRQYQIAAPESVDEQIRISEILRAADHMIDQSRIRLAKLERLRIGLMQDLLTGQRRVTDLLVMPGVAST